MAVVHVTTDNFEQEVMQSEKPVLIDFWAGWCGPCMMLGPVVEELAEEVTDVKMLILIKNGQVAAKDIGVKSKEELLEFMHQ